MNVKTNPSGVIKIAKQGAPEVLRFEQEEIKAPGYGQILLKQEAIGVNFVDTLFRSGAFPIQQFPAYAGVEGAGVVLAVGDGVDEFTQGDRVAYHFNFGSYAHYRVMNTQNLVHLPEDISFEQAAALQAKGLTTNVLANLAYSIKSGDKVLIHAAAGGVGSLLGRWAKSMGAFLIGTVGTEAKKKQLTHLDGVVVLGQEDLKNAVLALTGGAKIDVLYDGVGKSTFTDSLELIKAGGTAVNFGGASGYPAVSEAILKEKQIHFVRPDVGAYIQSRSHLAALSAEVYEKFRKGDLGNLNITQFPLENAAEAHSALENRQTTGSLILIP